MFEEVQRLRVNQLKNKLECLRMEYAAMFDEVNAIDGQLRVFRYAEKQVRNYQRKRHFLWERFTKRKQYLAYKANLAMLKKYPVMMMSLSNRLAHAELEVADEIKSSRIVQKIESLERQVAQAETAKNLEELGLTAADAVKLIFSDNVKTNTNGKEL